MQLKHLTVVAIAFMMLTATQLTAADGGAGQGPRKANHADILGRLHQRVVRIDKHIDRLNEAVENHPQAPENIKADVTKLVGDLGTQKGNVGTLIGCIQQKDKEGAKAAHATVKSQREVIKADIATLRADRQAWKATRPQREGNADDGAGAKPAGKRHGNKQK